MKRNQTFLFFVLFILICIPLFADNEVLKIHFLDVGEGDSILIETPKGKAILIDSGNLITGFKVTQYLKKNNLNNLEHLIFTHLDLDHIGGSFFILQMLSAKNIYDNGQDSPEKMNFSEVYRWYKRLVRENKNYRILKAGDHISADGVTLKVLWPEEPILTPDFNSNSIVIMLEYGEFRCLLTGDLTVPSELKILGRNLNLKADVLKVGHHGAKDANCEEFLQKVNPRIAILSVNSNNFYGYPDRKAIERIRKLGSRLYRTDESGDIVLSILLSKNKEPEIRILTNANRSAN